MEALAALQMLLAAKSAEVAVKRCLKSSTKNVQTVRSENIGG